jgi:hypothetical protein
MRVYGLVNITGYVNRVSSFYSGSKEEEVSPVFHELYADLCTNKQTYNSKSSGVKKNSLIFVKFVYMYLSTKSLRGFEKLWPANKPHAVCGRS